MNLITYRGPGMSGGLSSGMTQAFDRNAQPGQKWWHIKNRQIAYAADTISAPSTFDKLEEEMLDGHYRYCNEFLWPVMHDLPEHAVYNSRHHRQYLAFNGQFGRRILQEASSLQRSLFVHDYQLATLANSLARQDHDRLAIFWHIPWPNEVKGEHISYIAEIAQGLLRHDYIGFHTLEYAESFLNFVQEYLPRYQCNLRQLSIAPVGEPTITGVATPSRSTHLVVAPLGVDAGHWEDLCHVQQAFFGQPAQPDLPLVLSVDRADYTKGIFERLQAIECFLQTNPDWHRKMQFLQISAKTRSGMDAFDSYWHKCQALASGINRRWASDDGWTPIQWHSQPMSSAELSTYYQNAAVMLVTPIRDGLNLTAKEFVICQQGNPGVLALSKGAGVFNELGEYALPVTIESTRDAAESVKQALSLNYSERKARMTLLKQQVKKNPLSIWWQTFDHLLDVGASLPTTAAKSNLAA